MQAFSHSQNFVLSNPVITDHSNHYHSGLSGIDFLRESSALEAAFDSNFRRYAPSCFPGTRSQYIKDIVIWGTAQSAFPMYRMTGPAGVGKSAVAQTCAEELLDRCQLGASFFFKFNGCNDYSRFFTSISYQLSSKSPAYHEILDKKLRLDPTIVRKQLRSQFRELIVEPLRELELAGKQIEKKVILVDGLDECKDREAQREIIEIVITSISTRSTPFYWAFFSRPEPQIEAAFADHRVTFLCISTFLPVSRGIDGEIELYLRCGLQNILRRRGITTTGPWPSEQDIHALVSAAQGLYIYAATVLRFIGRTDTQYDPQELLHIVLKASTQGPNGSSTRPFEELDAFYTSILQCVPDALHSSVQLLLSFMALDRIEGGRTSGGIHFLCNVLRFSEIKLKMLCGELAAIIDPPSRLNFNKTPLLSSPNAYHLLISEFASQEIWLSYCHKSFLDFIVDPARSGSFCVNTPATRNNLFRLILEVQIENSKHVSFNSDRDLILTGSGSNVADVIFCPFNSEIQLLNLFPYDDLDTQLLRGLGDLDYRQYLSICSYRLIKNSCWIFNFHCSTKVIRGTVLSSNSHQCSISTFDIETFRRGILRLEEAQVMQRYQPSSTTLDFPLFRCDSNGNLLSGLYIRGRDQASTFLYWTLDSEMRSFRCFESADLTEGERVFREENFELWDEEGQRR
ncbi:hypothetical protein AGABI1DRAFT_129568 [Agaricus bisporus var. burnettii JB137-S8]|uniref:Nephrocystin 3-like N-terminal domain-containing protein n=1 Tax=Agaricus bisporus var. burnettii (strain JB137-S8 / ATCC MYA-4627 / FGSC 10392) TaxID=597362 RepID=K5X669_AGABU|nr:uncharacterized protein AGABI1DRAFT_129568 [Agaricus bisporus var. burnettii JB137-S8]EKM78462.1 hypothetical protein AGABI1DRAFT_129568 [Agaricus bisporus var. burnettii JB137-S8]